MTSPDVERIIAAHHEARAFYRHHLLNADGPQRYLASRGLQPTLEPVDGAPWYLGYAPPGWTTLTKHLGARDFNKHELLAAGLATRSSRGTLIDTFRDRIMFPVHQPDGQPVAFLGRASPRRTDTPKYLNTRNTVAYHKGQTLYGFGEQAIAAADGALPVLVEGPIDVLAVHLAHPDHTHIGVAACGSNLTAEHARALISLPGATRHGIVVAFDNDAAGHAANLRAWRLLAVRPGVNLGAAELPTGLDPGQLAGEPDRLRAAIHNERPLSHVLVDQQIAVLQIRHPDLLRWVDGRVRAVHALTALVAQLPADRILAVVPYIAERTQTTLDAVTDSIIVRLERSVENTVTQPGFVCTARARSGYTSDAQPLTTRPRGPQR
jgi:DNA primase